MMFIALALTVCVQQPALPKIPKAEATKFAQLFTDALADPDPKNASKVTAAAKALQAKFEFASLVAALREGPLYAKGELKPRGKGKTAEVFETFGEVTSGFTFHSGDDVFRYCVDLPEKYDSARAWPLLIDPGHGSGAKMDAKGKADFVPFWRNQCTNAGVDAIVVRTEIVEQIGADGLKGARPEDEVALAFDRCFRDICSRVHVDLNRVWVSGLSQTGFWSWQLGLERADRFAGIAPMSAVTWGTRGYTVNFGNLAVYVLHGDDDKICPVAQPRATCKELEALGVRLVYKEIAGAGHDGRVWGQLPDGLTWLAARPRDPYPKKIAKSVQTLAQPWCNWICLDALEKTGPGKAGSPPTGVVKASIDAQTIAIESDGVTRCTLALSGELVDLSKPIVVTWNGKKRFEGKLERDFARTAQIALDKVDWTGTFEATLELK